MKTSALIKKLQSLEKDIPFDAEVVIGDDWQPSRLKRVFHEPPYTFLVFDGEDARARFSEQEKILTRSFIAAGLEQFKSGAISLEQAVSVLGELLDIAHGSSAEEVVSFIKRTAGPAKQGT